MDGNESNVAARRRPDLWKHEPIALAGRRVLVTGGSTGIGRTTALLLTHLGARVAIVGRHQDALDDAQRDIAAVTSASRTSPTPSSSTRTTPSSR